MKMNKKLTIILLVLYLLNKTALLCEKKDLNKSNFNKTQTTLIKGNFMNYQVKQELYPKNLDGISEKQISEHWKLYEGYVAQTNKLQDELKNGDSSALTYSDRRRRLSFELNGIILHELYFENLKPNLSLSKNSELINALTSQFGSFEKWKEDFENCGKTRGIGWTILYYDTTTKNFFNTFIAEHEIGHIASLKPILIMDVWEHAYMVDHGATERGKYITAFMKNINWEVVEDRFSEAI